MSPDVLANILERGLHRMTRELPDVFNNVMMCLDKTVMPNAFTWSAACSGSEAPRWIFRAIRQNESFFRDLHAKFTMREFVQLISAEMVPWKRRFIREAAQCWEEPHAKQLFADMWDVTRATACNLATGEDSKLVERPMAGTESWFVGFSCKTASGLACAAKQKQGEYIENRSGSGCDGKANTTGNTLSSTICVLQQDQPRCFACENVEGLDTDGQIHSVVNALSEAGPGYVVCFWKHSPLLSGIPQCRWRYWFTGFAKPWLEAAGVEAHQVTEQANSVIASMRVDLEPMPMEQFFLPDTHPATRTVFMLLFQKFLSKLGPDGVISIGICGPTSPTCTRRPSRRP